MYVCIRNKAEYHMVSRKGNIEISVSPPKEYTDKL